MKSNEQNDSTQNIGIPEDSWRSIDIATLSIKERYKLLVSSILPRPIALVSSCFDDGTINLAPFSSFNLVCSNPMTVVFSVARKPDGSKKDTLLNIERSKEFVINTASEWFIESLDRCADEPKDGLTVLEHCGLTTIKSLKVTPVRIKESPIQMECVLHKLIELGDGGAGSASLIIGEVKHYHIAKSVCEKADRINIEKLKPIGRLAGSTYATIGRAFELKRGT